MSPPPPLKLQHSTSCLGANPGPSLSLTKPNFKMNFMPNIIDWSFGALDTIFSTRKSAAGEIPCPDGTYISGYALNAWKKWGEICLNPLSVENVEQVWILAFLIVSSLMLGAGIGFIYYCIEKKSALTIDASKRLISDLTKKIEFQSGQLFEIKQQLIAVLEKMK